jgi:hypothetical protein
MLKSLSDILGESSVAPEAPLVEPALNLPIFCNGLAKAAVKDGALVLAFYVDLDGPCGVERVLNLRVVMQAHMWRETSQKIDEAIAAFKRTFNS